MVQNLSFITQFLALGAVTATTTALLIWLMRPLLARVVDTPNHRSLHATPTPRGAGVAVMVVALTVLSLWAFYMGDVPRSFLPMLAGAALLALVSFADDVGDLNPATRLFAQAVAVALAAGFLPVDAMLFQGFLPFWADRFILVFGWMWFLNLYNFMDGVDGITGAQTVHIGLSLVALSFFATLPLWLPLTGAVLAGVALGFLVWNWHPARLFLGDVGSVPLGYIAGYALIWLAITGYPLAAFLVALYYLFDAGFTLLHRLANGHKPWQAHRSHGYQRAVQSGLSPQQVVALIIGVNGILLVAALATTQLATVLGYTAALVAACAAAGLVAFFYRRFNAKTKNM